MAIDFVHGLRVMNVVTGVSLFDTELDGSVKSIMYASTGRTITVACFEGSGRSLLDRSGHLHMINADSGVVCNNITLSPVRAP